AVDDERRSELARKRRRRDAAEYELAIHDGRRIGEEIEHADSVTAGGGENRHEVGTDASAAGRYRRPRGWRAVLPTLPRVGGRARVYLKSALRDQRLSPPTSPGLCRHLLRPSSVSRSRSAPRLPGRPRSRAWSPARREPR